MIIAVRMNAEKLRTKEINITGNKNQKDKTFTHTKMIYEWENG